MSECFGQLLQVPPEAFFGQQGRVKEDHSESLASTKYFLLSFSVARQVSPLVSYSHKAEATDDPDISALFETK
jgi:hypothetical protein